MLTADLHIHSKYSSYKKLAPLANKFKILDSVTSPEEIITWVKRKGIKVFSVTDHDSLEVVQKIYPLAEKEKLLFIPGVEITSSHGHLLAYGIKTIPRSNDPEKIIEHVHKEKGIAVCAHPFDFKHRWHGRILKYEFDAIEVYNAGALGDKKALRFAKRYDYPVVAGSDAHTPWSIGGAVTFFPDNCRTVADCLWAIKNKKTKVKLIKHQRVDGYYFNFLWVNVIGRFRKPR